MKVGTVGENSRPCGDYSGVKRPPPGGNRGDRKNYAGCHLWGRRSDDVEQGGWEGGEGHLFRALVETRRIRHRALRLEMGKRSPLVFTGGVPGLGRTRLNWKKDA